MDVLPKNKLRSNDPDEVRRYVLGYNRIGYGAIVYYISGRRKRSKRWFLRDISDGGSTFSAMMNAIYWRDEAELKKARKRLILAKLSPKDRRLTLAVLKHIPRYKIQSQFKLYGYHYVYDLNRISEIIRAIRLKNPKLNACFDPEVFHKLPATLEQRLGAMSYW